MRVPRFTIHTDLYYRKFLTKKCSIGYIVAVFITILVYILPFITMYSTGGNRPIA
jgi:hypothetical protein